MTYEAWKEICILIIGICGGLNLGMVLMSCLNKRRSQ